MNYKVLMLSREVKGGFFGRSHGFKGKNSKIKNTKNGEMWID